MSEVERRLTHDEHEPAAFLQANIGRSHQEIVVERIGDRGGRLHGTRDHEHAVVQERARRNRRAEIVVVVDDVGECREVGRGAVGLELDRPHRLARQHQVNVDVGTAQRRERGQRVGASARSGDPDDDPFSHLSPLGFAVRGPLSFKNPVGFPSQRSKSTPCPLLLLPRDWPHSSALPFATRLRPRTRTHAA